MAAITVAPGRGRRDRGTGGGRAPRRRGGGDQRCGRSPAGATPRAGQSGGAGGAPCRSARRWGATDGRRVARRRADGIPRVRRRSGGGVDRRATMLGCRPVDGAHRSPRRRRCHAGRPRRDDAGVSDRVDRRRAQGPGRHLGVGGAVPARRRHGHAEQCGDDGEEHQDPGAATSGLTVVRGARAHRRSGATLSAPGSARSTGRRSAGRRTVVRVGGPSPGSADRHPGRRTSCNRNPLPSGSLNEAYEP